MMTSTKPVDALKRSALVVIPALNEAATIGLVVEKARSLGYDVLVVDDGSTDETATIAARLGARVARLPFNLGVGGAMRTGFKFALNQGYDAVVQVDGDGQHDPRLIPLLLERLTVDDADIAIGNRFAGEDYTMSSSRHLAIRVLARMSSTISNTTLHDATSGFRAHSARAIRVYAQHYPCEYLGDTVESLVIARKSGLRVIEVGVAMHQRAGGRASQGTASSVKYVARVMAAAALGLARTWPLEEAAQ